MVLLVVALVFTAGPAEAAPGDVLFSDDFESGSLDNWTQTDGPNGRAGVDDRTSNSGSFSMFVEAGNPGGGPFSGGNPVVVTQDGTVDLSPVAGAEVEFWYRRGDDAFSEDTDAGDDFFVQFRRADGSWTTVDAAAGSGPTGETLFHRFQLPTAALHADLKLRMINFGTDNDGIWHVDDVRIVETNEPGTGQGPGFCEDFEGGLSRFASRFESTESEFRRAGTGIHTANSGNRSLFLRWDSVAFESRRVDFSSGQPARVRAWIRRGADAFSENPEAGEDLIIEYFDDGGSWRELDRFAGGGTAGEVFDVSLPVPADGLHADFRVRVHMPDASGADFDYWHIDDLCARHVTATEYRMDEAGWGGTSGEVVDNTGNGHDATAVGGATTAGADPARAGDPGTCRYGTFDGADDGVDDGDAGAYLEGLEAVTVTGWVYNADGLSGNNRGIFFTDDPSSGKDHRLGLRYDTSGINGGGNNVLKAGVQTTDCSDGEDCVQVETESGVMVEDEWQHVAMTWKSGGDLRVYVDGSDVTGDGTGDIGQGTGGTLDAVNGLRIAQGAKGERWQGRIDEFRIYSAALNSSEIQRIFQDTHPCPGVGVDNFRLVHDNAGINCRAEDIVLRAEDASGNVVTSYTGDVDLSTTTANGDWAIGTGNGSLSDSGADDGAATYSFDATDDGEVTLQYSNTQAETLNIDATAGVISDDDTEGDITFRPWGFEFSPDPIPTRIAGRPFDLTLQAVGELPSDPGCNVIEEYDGDRDLRFWFDYEDPDSGTVAVTVDGTAIASTESGADDQTITFSNGEATVPVDYRDAGEIQLHARDDTGVGEPPSDSGDELVSGGAIGGGTNPFVVRPFGFYLDFDPDGDGTFDDRGANGSCGGQVSCATDASGDVFTTAGADFDLRIAAVVWQSGDDADGDGRPDGNRILADNAETPNFGQEGTPEEIDLAHALVAPSDGVIGSLDNGTDLGGFSGGVLTVNNLRYSEVGIIDLDASLSDGAYLGTVDVTGAVDDVGRFKPEDFSQTATDGMFRNTCTATFTYLGETFGYETGGEPELTITARNIQGQTTRNYTDGFAKLVPGDVDRTGPTADGSRDGRDGTPLEVDPALSTGTLTDNGDGTLTYTFSADDDYRYLRNLDRDGNGENDALVAPFDSDLTVTIDAIVDSDDVEAPDGNREDVSPDPVLLRFGRLVIDNAAGAEIAPVEQVLRAEYFEVADGEQWTVNTDDDGCTAFALAAPGHEIELANDDDADSPVAGDSAIDVGGGETSIQETGPVALDQGQAILTFSAPGAENTGWVDTIARLGVEHPYLAIDDDGDGVWDANPTGRVTFGIYTGPAGRILIREVPAN